MLFYEKIVFASIRACYLTSFLISCEEVFEQNAPDDACEAVDLGLSVKWATHNVGATKPEEYGGYYAWGETDEKVKNYSDGTYKWNDGNNAVVKYCTNGNDGIVDNKTTLDPEDDVACIKWGSNWRMPTIEEQNELRDSCIWRWTKVNDVNGFWWQVQTTTVSSCRLQV